jgi:CTP:molybdopterin cytidylyltransferase MocA
MRLAPRSVDALVLAGGMNRIVFYPGHQPGPKALIEYHGRVSIEYALDALRASPYVRNIGIVGPVDLLRERIPGGPYLYAPSGDTPVASVVNGLSHFRDADHVLVTSADVPLITPAAVDEFLEACAREPTESDHNVFIGGVPRESFSGPFARSAKPFMRFRDVEVCHGNLIVVEPGVLDKGAAGPKINALYAARKNPIACALAIGFRVGVSYLIGVHLLHRLTMRQMAAITSWRFGVGVIPVLVNRPEIALDVDEPEDYQLVSAMLEESAPQPPAPDGGAAY